MQQFIGKSKRSKKMRNYKAGNRQTDWEELLQEVADQVQSMQAQVHVLQDWEPSAISAGPPLPDFWEDLRELQGGLLDTAAGVAGLMSLIAEGQSTYAEWILEQQREGEGESP